MNATWGARIGWRDLPGRVRRAVEGIVGGRVTEAVPQTGGFSPGTADRIRTAGGRRAFVKAVSAAQNDLTPELHRREARITAALPDHVPVPRLFGCYDDGEWVALVLEDVEGRHPTTPWTAEELSAVRATLAALARSLTPAPPLDLPTAADTLAHDLGGWWRISADPPADLDPWAAQHLEMLGALAARGRAALAGDTLVHADIRADNILLCPDGRVMVIDWPWACRGPAWLDTLLLLVNVRLYGGHDTQALLTRCAAMTGAEVDDLVAVLCGLAGFLLDEARRVPSPGLPTLRSFQRAQGDAVLSWLREALPVPA